MERIHCSDERYNSKRLALRISNTIVAADASNYITGQAIVVDGGTMIV